VEGGSVIETLKRTDRSRTLEGADSAVDLPKPRAPACMGDRRSKTVSGGGDIRCGIRLRIVRACTTSTPSART